MKTILIIFQAGSLSPLVLAPGLGMILVAAAFVMYALRRGGRWGYLGLGALAWTVTVIIKFLIALAVNRNIYSLLTSPNAPLFAPGNILFYLYVGSLTGLTEVLITWLVLRYTRLGRAIEPGGLRQRQAAPTIPPRYVPWRNVLAFGVGFGAFEALLLGLSSLAGMLAGLLAPHSLPASTITALAQANNPLFDLAPIVERIATIFCHILANTLLFYALITGRARWVWVSFLYKTLLDSVAAFAQTWGVGSMVHIWIIEAIIVVFGIVGWWGTRAIAQRYNDVPAGQTAGNIE